MNYHINGNTHTLVKGCNSVPSTANFKAKSNKFPHNAINKIKSIAVNHRQIYQCRLATLLTSKKQKI